MLPLGDIGACPVVPADGALQMAMQSADAQTAPAAGLTLGHSEVARQMLLSAPTSPCMQQPELHQVRASPCGMYPVDGQNSSHSTTHTCTLGGQIGGQNSPSSIHCRCRSLGQAASPVGANRCLIDLPANWIGAFSSTRRSQRLVGSMPVTKTLEALCVDANPTDFPMATHPAASAAAAFLNEYCTTAHTQRKLGFAGAQMPQVVQRT